MNKSINCILLQNFFIKALTLLSFHHTWKNLSQFFFFFCRNQKLSSIRFRVFFLSCDTSRLHLNHCQRRTQFCNSVHLPVCVSICPRFPAVLCAFLFIYFPFLLSVKSHKGGDLFLCELFKRIYHFFLTALQRFAFVKPIEKSIF